MIVYLPIVNSPSSNFSTPRRILRRDVLPEPLVPNIPTISPSFTSRLMFFRASTSSPLSNLYDFERFFTLIIIPRFNFLKIIYIRIICYFNFFKIFIIKIFIHNIILNLPIFKTFSNNLLKNFEWLNIKIKIYKLIINKKKKISDKI